MFSPTRVRRLAATAYVLALCLSLPACGGKSKLTKANFDKVAKGMSIADVEAILGRGEKETGDGSNIGAQVGVDVGGGLQPASGSTGEEHYTWEKGNKKIDVWLRQGKVVNFQQTGL